MTWAGLGFKLGFFEANFDSFSTEELHEAKNSYDNGTKLKKIVHSQYFSPQWIRQANEALSADIDHKNLWFAAPADSGKTDKKGLDISKIYFTDKEKYTKKQESLRLKLNDFIEHQNFVVQKTIHQCSLIETTSSVTGVTRFDLPKNLQKQTGPDKTRKDSYSTLVLANWGKYCWFKMQDTQIKKRSAFKPKFIG